MKEKTGKRKRKGEKRKEKEGKGKKKAKKGRKIIISSNLFQGACIFHFASLRGNFCDKVILGNMLPEWKDIQRDYRRILRGTVHYTVHCTI